MTKSIFFTGVALAVGIASAAGAEGRLTYVTILDGLLDPMSIGCPNLVDTHSHTAAMMLAKSDFQQKGIPVDATLFDALKADGCRAFVKGTTGYLYKDDEGNFFAKVDVAEYTDGSYELEAGSFYFTPRAYRSDVATVLDLSRF